MAEIHSCILSQYLWYNKSIHVDKASVHFLTCFEKSINYDSQLFSENGSIKKWHEFKVHGKTTDDWHTDDIRVTYGWHTSGIRVTYEYIRLTYGWHTSTYEWHTSDIRLTYDWHMSDIRVHTNDIRMKCKIILNCI